MAPDTTDTTFSDDVLNSDLPVLVDFWAPWCAPCGIAGPIIDNVANKTSGKARVYKLNIDNNPETVRTYGVTGIPTIIIFKNGKMSNRLVGVQPESMYLEALK